MADFDADRIYYSHQNLQQQQPDEGATSNAATDGRLEDEEERAVDSDALRRHYREFLSKWYHHYIAFIYRYKLQF